MTHTADDRVALPAPGGYTIDAGRSTVTFATRHFFGLGAVRGTFSLSSGQVHVAADPTQSSATAVIDAGSFATGNDTRDKVVRSSKYLDVATYPRISFVSTAVREAGAGYVVLGELTVKAAARPVELAVEKPAPEAGGIRFKATTRIDRYEFGITADKGMTARYLTLSLDILIAPAAA
ncbi:YceI family protein [Actinoplanes sp. DH11]|uniref:YceI family protein n=1 Tax=Actinoplanes sp. DH11 TaxID=2857011 RepID=UPI001E55CA82|nr:YceI family protein [Actinoplanes sp. DH11]